MKVDLRQITLRSWQSDDIDNLVKYANNYNIANFLSNKFPYPYTYEDGQNFIQFANAHASSLVYAIVYHNEAIGGIGVHEQDDIYEKNVELGYWVAEPYWNQGIVTHVIPMVVKSAFQKLPINRIFARPFGSNKASQRALEKCGFIKEAVIPQAFFKNDRYEDELIYAVRRETC